MTIQDKLNKVIEDDYIYEFCEMKFQLFKNDYIQIFKKGNIFPEIEVLINNIDKIPKDLLNSEYKKEVLVKLPSSFWVGRRHPFAICFYLEASEKIEKPISMKTKFI